MYCVNCGKQITEDDKYCRHCGNKTPEPEQLQAEQQQRIGQLSIDFQKFFSDFDSKVVKRIILPNDENFDKCMKNVIPSYFKKTDIDFHNEEIYFIFNPDIKGRVSRFYSTTDGAGMIASSKGLHFRTTRHNLAKGIIVAALVNPLKAISLAYEVIPCFIPFSQIMSMSIDADDYSLLINEIKINLDSIKNKDHRKRYAELLVQIYSHE